MNGIGLLITILFCTIVWWGTASYYKAIMKDLTKANKRLRNELDHAVAIHDCKVGRL